MTRMPQIDVYQLIKFLKDYGYVEHRQKGSHLFLYNPINNIVISIPVHPGKDIGRGLTSKILKQTGFNANDNISCKQS